jgi:hypothetical protein
MLSTNFPNAGENFFIFIFFFIVLLFICAYKAWVISAFCPHPLPYHPLHPWNHFQPLLSQGTVHVPRKASPKIYIKDFILQEDNN